MKRTWKSAICIAVILGVYLYNSISTSRAYGYTEEIVNPADALVSNTKVTEKINENTEQIIDDCNNEIYNYFKKINVDVSYDLDKLEQHIFLYEESNSEISLLGYYCNSSIYLNETLLEDVDQLKFTYIHEAIHYLGFLDNESTMLMEGMADVIAEDILGYYYTGSYDVPRALCHQLIIADPNVIQFIMNGGDLDDKIDDCLRNGNPSYILDYNLTEIEYGELDTNTYNNYVNSCQEIISSYCETFELTDEQYKEIEEYILF